MTGTMRYDLSSAKPPRSQFSRPRSGSDLLDKVLLPQFDNDDATVLSTDWGWKTLIPSWKLGVKVQDETGLPQGNPSMLNRLALPQAERKVHGGVRRLPSHGSDTSKPGSSGPQKVDGVRYCVKLFGRLYTASSARYGPSM